MGNKLDLDNIDYNKLDVDALLKKEIENINSREKRVLNKIVQANRNILNIQKSGDIKELRYQVVRLNIYYEKLLTISIEKNAILLGLVAKISRANIETEKIKHKKLDFETISYSQMQDDGTICEQPHTMSLKNFYTTRR